MEHGQDAGGPPTDSTGAPDERFDADEALADFNGQQLAESAEPAPEAERLPEPRQQQRPRRKPPQPQARIEPEQQPAPPPVSDEESEAKPKRRRRGSRGGRGRRKKSAENGEVTPTAAQATSETGTRASQPVEVVRTGSTDRHLVDDEPVLPPPTRRPRSARDLDHIPDDFD